MQKIFCTSKKNDYFLNWKEIVKWKQTSEIKHYLLLTFKQ